MDAHFGKWPASSTKNLSEAKVPWSLGRGQRDWRRRPVLVMETYGNRSECGAEAPSEVEIPLPQLLGRGGGDETRPGEDFLLLGALLRTNVAVALTDPLRIRRELVVVPLLTSQVLPFYTIRHEPFATCNSGSGCSRPECRASDARRVVEGLSAVRGLLVCLRP